MHLYKNLQLILMLLLPTGNPLMPSRVAKNFLGALRKRGFGADSDQGATAAVEECCNEGCAYQEIAEYPCFS
jgi:hypothetical protein